MALGVSPTGCNTVRSQQRRPLHCTIFGCSNISLSAASLRRIGDTNGSRFCRANRILFKDYTEQCYWFGVVEIGVAQLSGLLMGIKLGYGQCVVTLFILIAVLAVFLIFVFWRRPYNSPFASVFAILTTFLQLVGACFLAGWMFSGKDSYRSSAEVASLISLYLLVGKTVLVAIPASRRVVVFLVTWVRRQRTNCCPSRPQDSIHGIGRASVVKWASTRTSGSSIGIGRGDARGPLKGGGGASRR
jgi:hypothetical protein